MKIGQISDKALKRAEGNSYKINIMDQEYNNNFGFR